MRVITVMGPSQSGKSTLVEALANLDGRSTRCAFSDVVDLTGFTYLGDDWTAIRIAGGPENLPAAGPALMASDAAVLCVSADPEAAVLAAPYLRLIDEARVPCFLFVNKADTLEGRMRDVVASLQVFSSHALVLRQIPMRDGGRVVGAVDLISERAWQYREGQPSALIALPDDVFPREQEARAALLESMADFDDRLLEQLIEDREPASEEVFGIAARVVQDTDVIEVFLGAARAGNGVTRLMKSLRHEAPPPTALQDRTGKDVTAVSFASDTRKHVGKVVALRATTGGLRAGSALAGANLGALTGLDGRTPAGDLPVGGLGLAVKSDHLPGTALLQTAEAALPPVWAQPRAPGYRRVVTPVNDRDDVRLSGALDRLSDIDPGVSLQSDPDTGKPVLSMQGPLHARRVTAKLADVFGVPVDLSVPPSAYRETLSRPVQAQYRHRKQSGGAGQFADVVLRLAPTGRGVGFRFSDEVKGGVVPRNFIPAVAAGAQDALAEGPNGFPVVDTEVILTDGKHHAVDSSDHAFRAAGKAAVRAALADAGTQILQPILSVAIHVPSVFAGGLVPVVSGLKGQVLGFEGHPSAAGWDVFTTLLPASACDDLFRDLGGASRGTAWFDTRFDHFEPISRNDLARQDPAALVDA